MIGAHGRTNKDRELKFGVGVRLRERKLRVNFRQNRIIFSIGCPGPVFFKWPPRADDLS